MEADWSRGLHLGGSLSLSIREYGSAAAGPSVFQCRAPVREATLLRTEEAEAAPGRVALSSGFGSPRRNDPSPT